MGKVDITAKPLPEGFAVEATAGGLHVVTYGGVTRGKFHAKVEAVTFCFDLAKAWKAAKQLAAKFQRK